MIVPDPAGELDLPADLVAALCDRRRGIGGDGVLRIVRTAETAALAAAVVELDLSTAALKRRRGYHRELRRRSRELEQAKP